MIRLTDQELEVLLNDTEADRAERKESFKGDAPKRHVKQFVLLPMTCPATTSPEFFLLEQKTMENHQV
jgi:hypothetical protein